MSEELKQYLAIDKLALDHELVTQPSLYYKICEAYVEAAAERDLCKEELAYADAEIDREVRTRLGDKCTEGKVKSAVAMDQRHVQATNHYLETKMKAEKLQALKEAFHQRSYMLRDLAQLFISNYYGATSVRTTPATEEDIYKLKRKQR